ncbi:hypothetical protein ABEB36_012693 [Hypothenemus hampei]|uniref:Nose resistant-to-fluoxetine protein N-terminal domain-containing protein n=1 Tax=Hypothenemus hampei TaxID=57062 RepID=A0ABD1ECT7_HYPHA
MCRNAHHTHLEAARRYKLNSLKLFDASAKLPSGIFRGNVNQLGDFDECLEVPDAQYCLALIDLQQLLKYHALFKYQNLIHAHFAIQETSTDPGHRVPGSSFVRWGICIPKACSPNDLTLALETKLNVKAYIKSNMCQINTSKKEVSYVDYLASGYFIIILLLVSISTGLYNRGYSFNETLSMKILGAFAIQNNLKSALKISKNSNEYTSVHGVRFFSALALLMAHKTMALLYNPYINKTWMAETQAMKWSVIGRNSVVYTDCFLLISGLLNARTILTDLDNCNSIKFTAKLFNRLIRIFPGLLTVILFCTYILPHMGAGPLWPIVIESHAELCKKNMWRNFLFIHNYFGFDQMCLTHTHQIGIDMQLFIITPLIVYLLRKNSTLGLRVLFGICAISTMLRFYNVLYYNLSYVVHFGIPISRMFDTADYSYILPSHRATIYFIGVVLAWYLQIHKKSPLSKKTIFYIWSIIYLIGFSTWLGPIGMSIQGYQYNNIEAALYSAIYPITWGCAIAWLIYAAESGIGGIFAPLIQWRYFQLFTKIAYGVYLVQFPLFFYNVGITRHAAEYKTYMMLPFVDAFFVIILASILTLFVDIPCQNIYKLLKNKYFQ